MRDINSYCGRKKKKKLLHFSICFVRKQSRWIISCSEDFSSNPRSGAGQRNTCAQALKYYRLLLINMSKLSQFKSHSNSFSLLLSYESWMMCRSFFLTYLTFLAVTEICLSPFYLLPEKPCWLVFSHFTLGFIPLTPNAQPGWAA